MESNFKRNLIISSAISVLILIISSTASFLSINSLLESNVMVNHTQQIIYNLNNANRIILDAQGGVRGYLVTGNDLFLEQYLKSEAEIDKIVVELDILTSDNATQQNRIRLLKEQLLRFYNYTREKINLKRNVVPLGFDDLNQGKKIMDTLHWLYTQMENEELLLLKIRIEKSKDFGIYSSILILFAALISIVLSSSFFIKILNDYKERAALTRLLQTNEKETARRISMVSAAAEKIIHGDYSIKVEENAGELGIIGTSLNVMSQSLQKNFDSLASKEWVKNGIATLNEVMIGEKDLYVLTNDILNYLAEYTESNAAVFYLAENDSLKFASGYSYHPDVSKEQLAFGEGLTGQAAVSKKLIELKSFSNENVNITFALGEIQPQHIVAFPIIDGFVAGVIELASLRIYSDIEIEFFNSIANNIAIAIKAAESRKRVRELLEHTAAQTEELKVQHAELEGMNAELEIHTERLQASEEELRVQHEELLQTNEELAERSALLEERNVEIQKKSEDLEITTRYKSEFLDNMSHELRTPLNSILLLSRLLSENNESNMTAAQIEFAKVIQTSGNGLLGLIDEILDLSKIEAGKMELDNTEIAITDVSDNLYNLFNVVANEKKIEFKIINDQAPLLIKSDQGRLEQILKNLISNAIKFTNEGYVSLEILKHPQEENKVQFIVKDTGIGIPLLKQPLIFEAFQQADSSTKRKYGGTGLGLSISRELSKLLGGEITLSSQLNGGSIFTLTIPVVPIKLDFESSNDYHDYALDERENEIRSKLVQDKNKYIIVLFHNIIDDISLPSGFSLKA